eukprot:TRINITY_DN4217_c0_g5_i1.p1 TRINITY_DN4217_c0_g5~~TRINITY_DN4217_c0_g5_i1.p1  ORF type:complete len:933 (-),score=111.95 TRINITY_DN4217_c0_g5_i1:379-3177(-)
MSRGGGATAALACLKTSHEKVSDAVSDIECMSDAPSEKAGGVDQPKFRDLMATAESMLKNLSNVLASLKADHERELAAMAHGCRHSFRDDDLSSEGIPPLRQESCSSDIRASSKPRSNMGSSAVMRPPPPEKCEDSSLTPSEPPSPLSGVSRPCSSFLDACVNGSDDEIRRWLDSGVDPNQQFDNFTCIGKSFLTGTPLVCLVLRGKTRLLSTIVERGANLEGQYSFVAGAEQIVWSGTAIHAAIPSGNLDLIKELISLGADIHTRGSNGATLLWQASYFGQLEVAEYLLGHRIDLELKAQSQDDAFLSYTPLHAAANAGHAHMVAMLLRAKANITVDSGRDTEPLDDAILHGHADVVQHLVANGANIFRCKRKASDKLKSDGSNPSLGTPRRASTQNFLNVCIEENNRKRAPRDKGSENTALRCIDIVFASDNPVLISGVAMGLKNSTALLDRLPAADFIRFLLAPGEAPVHIMNAVFRSYPLIFWQNESNKLRRVMMRAAFVDGVKRSNLAEGPHKDDFMHLFNTKQTLPPVMQDFVSTLAPKRMNKRRGMFVPATFTMCHVPNVHTDLEVLMALAHGQQKDIFSNPGCQAILNFAWEREKTSAKIGMVMAFIEVMNLVAINFILNETNNLPSLELSNSLLIVANLLALAVLIVVAFGKAMEMIGHLSRGLKAGTATFLLFDAVVLSLTCCVVIWTWQLGLEAKSTPAYNIALGILVFVKWMRLLMSLRLIESIGMRILPITTTMWDVGPFCAVLAVYLIGSANMYYALGIHSFPRCFLIIYRMVVLGDVDLNEMENVWGSDMHIEEVDGRTAILQTVSASTEYYYVVRAMMLFISFVMGLSMMNLFIAMLCLSYANATEVATTAFMKSRALAMIDHYAYRSGLLSLKSLFRRVLPRKFSKVRGDEHENGGPNGHGDLTKRYLWTCSQKD